jgi:hypothetical protein
MLKITDLTVSKEMASNEMARVVGGMSDLEMLSALIDLSTSVQNKVADVNQGFGLNLDQSNVGYVTNNQILQNGNGVLIAPVYQTQTQGNFLDLLGLGNTAVS